MPGQKEHARSSLGKKRNLEPLTCYGFAMNTLREIKGELSEW